MNKGQKRRDVYLRTVLGQVPRLLGQLDRNPCSTTYGSFDWLNWHDKITGFPNGHAQESMLVLALLHRINDRDNPYHNNDNIRAWAIAALGYWARILHRDGTTDEFYLNERQLGATAISLYAACRTYLAFSNHMAKDDCAKVESAISRAASTLAAHDETSLLSNHQAQVIAALHYAGKILHKDFSAAIRKRLVRIIEGQSEDGWFVEYGGPDLGYLTTAISFLAEYHEASGDESVVGPLKKAIHFMKFFLFPDGTYGGIIGSRNTAHCWTAGLETMHRLHPGEFGEASVICQRAAEKMGSMLTPEKEDRYFSEQMYDYLQAYIQCSGQGNLKLPFEGPDFTVHFSQSNILISKSRGKYLVINGNKGGLLRIYGIKDERILAADSGIVAGLSDGRIAITGSQSPNRCTWADNKFSAEGRLMFFSQQSQSVLKLSSLNIGMQGIAYNVKVSNLIKDRLIAMLISGRKPAPLRFRRQVDLSAGEVIDELWLDKGITVKSLSASDNLKDIFVAYSKYFDLSELYTTWQQIGRQDIAELNKSGYVKIGRKLWQP